MTPEFQSRLIAILGRELFFASLGSPLGKRMNKPRPGDIVVEISGPTARTDPDGVGKLVSVMGEPPYEEVVIEPLHTPGVHRKWANSTWIAVPTERTRRWLGEPQPRTKYAPLQEHLQCCGRDRVELTFAEIERIIDDFLPSSAHRPDLPWWEDDPTHVQSLAWVDAGYSAEVDHKAKRVTFTRPRGR